MPQPVFIVGSGRSGTSVLTWAIGQHPNIHVVPETDWMTALASWTDGLYKIGMAQHPSGHFSRWNVTEEIFLEEMGVAIDGLVRRTFARRFPEREKSLTGAIEQRGLAWFRSASDTKSRWVNGTPSSTGYAGILAQMFPRARFINLVRNPDKVVRSWMGASFRHPDVAEANDLVTHIYHSQKAGYLAHAAFGDRAIRVMLDDLSADPEAGMRDVMRFVGEDYSSDCLKPLQEKINSSGEIKDEVLREYSSIADSDLMKEMRDWYAKAADKDWRIEGGSELAEMELALYARHKIPLPQAA